VGPLDLIPQVRALEAAGDGEVVEMVDIVLVEVIEETGDVAKDVTEDVADDVAEDVAKDVTEVVAEVVAEDVAEVVANDVALLEVGPPTITVEVTVVVFPFFMLVDP